MSITKDIEKKLLLKNKNIDKYIKNNDTESIINELSVFEAELLAQNEELYEKEQVLLKRNLELELLFKQAPNPYIILDSNCLITDYNLEAEIIFNYIQINKSFTNYIKKGNTYDFFIWFTEKKFLENDLEIFLNCNILSKKETRKFRIKGNIHPENPSIFYLFLIDIHDQFVLTNHLKEKVEEEVKKLKEQNELLLNQSKLAEMGELVRSIAHQWRQPLNYISTLLMNIEIEIHKKDSNTNLIKNNLNKINNTNTSLSSLLDDFLTFFKPSLGVEEYNLIDVYKASIKFSNYKIGKKIKLNLTYSNTNIFFTKNKNELIQIFNVLISNSIDAKTKSISNGSDNNLNIDIIHTKTVENLIIEYCDNAGGIEKNIINKIWEPYFTTKFDKQGVGIGLYMVKNIIENNLNGKITVVSHDKETKFYIKIKL